MQAATILVVDDHKYVRNTVCSLLMEQPGWQVCEAENGKDAIARARRWKPDVTVMDVVMPRMNGIEAAYELRKIVPATKIVFMSSHYTHEEAKLFACLFGQGAFVSKSEAGKSLVPAIQRLLDNENHASVARRRVETLPRPGDIGVRYPWQRAVLAALMELRPKPLALKIETAQRAISLRMSQPDATDLDERVSLQDAWRTLSVLSTETTWHPKRTSEVKRIA